MNAREESIAGRLWYLAGDVKISHSVFAMPFAILAGFLGVGGYPGTGRLVLIVVCMFFARTYAMLANRYIDREIDRANSRTSWRAVASGKVSGSWAVLGACICVVGLCVGALGFGVFYGNWWPGVLLPVPIVWLGVYPYMKRFTVWSHIFLGVALGMSVIGAGVAVEPVYLGNMTLWVLAGFVVFWVAGFDVIYALQDIEADRSGGLYSIPGRYGREKGLVVAKVLHLCALMLLVLAHNVTPAFCEHSVMEGVDMSYFTIGLIIVSLLLIGGHRAAGRGEISRAFFTFNGIISCVVGGLGIADVMLV